MKKFSKNEFTLVNTQKVENSFRIQPTSVRQTKTWRRESQVTTQAKSIEATTHTALAS